MKKNNPFTLIILLLLMVSFNSNAQDKVQPTTREMNLINWQEFQELVPSKIETVLLPVGSLEAHGVLPNGSDNLAPESMCREIAVRLNAMIAPTLNYGITPRLSPYPGAISINASSYKPFVTDIMVGLAKNKFKNIIVLTGHGGNTTLLHEVINEVANKYQVRMLVIDWWSLTSKVIFEVFGENGGHAANNETAYIQAIVPQHVHPERYTKEMPMTAAANVEWSAVPSPYTIGIYQEGQGYPTFDKKQSAEYFKKVNDKIAEFIMDIINRWDKAKLFR